jgi:hypothetical protein
MQNTNTLILFMEIIQESYEIHKLGEKMQKLLLINGRYV